MVKYEMCECAEGKSEELGLAVTPIKVKSGNSDQDEKKQRMAKYPAVTQTISEEEHPYRFVNDIRQKRTYEQKPHINRVS